MPEFQDRLEYLDERYEHLKKNVKALKIKMLELEGILKLEQDEESEAVIQDIIDTIKREKQLLRDEAAIIRGELSQATFKEEGRRFMTGERRKEEEAELAREKWLAEREEREAKEAEEREKRRQERLKEEEAEMEATVRKQEVDRQRAAAMDRLMNLDLYLGQSDGHPCMTPPELDPTVPNGATILSPNGAPNGTTHGAPNGDAKEGGKRKEKEKGRCFGLRYLFGGRRSSSSTSQKKNGTPKGGGNGVQRNGSIPRQNHNNNGLPIESNF